jgi:PII-like signaling protein
MTLEAAMEYVILRFYVHESHRLHWKPLWEWLLAEANKMGLPGGSAFRAMAGFGEHHVLHEDRFFELQGSLTVEVEFIVTEAQAQQLIERASQEKIRALYALIPARFGVIDKLADK